MIAPHNPSQPPTEAEQRAEAIIQREVAHVRGSLRVIWEIGGPVAAMQAVNLVLTTMADELTSISVELGGGGGLPS